MRPFGTDEDASATASSCTPPETRGGRSQAFLPFALQDKDIPYQQRLRQHQEMVSVPAATTPRQDLTAPEQPVS
jgi:hypothetical protein